GSDEQARSLALLAEGLDHGGADRLRRSHVSNPAAPEEVGELVARFGRAREAVVGTRGQRLPANLEERGGRIGSGVGRRNLPATEMPEDLHVALAVPEAASRHDLEQDRAHREDVAAPAGI